MKKKQKAYLGAPEQSLEINVYDEIFSWTVRGIVERLQASPDAPVTLRINSPGGDVQEAFALANVLKTHKGRKVAIVESLCASAATFVACACDELQMHSESLFMIHNPWGGATGDADEIEKYVEVLRKLESLMVGLYMRKSNADEATVRAWMSAETQMTPAEAKAAGFCDVIITEAANPTARASARRFMALLKLRTPFQNKKDTDMEETLRAKLAKYGLADDDSNIKEALAAYLAETDDAPSERKEMAKAVAEMEEEPSAKAEDDDDDEKDDEDKGEKAMSRVTSAMARQLAEADAERKALAKQVAALEKEREQREIGEVIAEAKSRGLAEADAKEFYRDFGKAGAMKWLAKFPRKVAALGKWNVGGGETPAEGSAVEKVNGVNVIGRGLAKAAQQILAKGEAKTLGEAQILAAKRNPHLYQNAE